MWNPANNLKWQKDAVCAQAKNQNSMEWFFSKEPKEKYAAKNLCFSCPVRKHCLQWALEHRQIWGIWGGKDEVEMRRTLSVSYKGEEARRRRFPNCPYCTARPSKLETSSIEVPGGGRWTTAKIVTCGSCGFAWRSRTSANAVEAYHHDRADKIERKQRLRAKMIEKAEQKKQRRTKQHSVSTSRPPEK
jgi:WhiB family redox-sensing transcriptional regulator